MKYAGSSPTPFHMPGHKLGKGIPPELLENMALLDLTEIPGMDNLHSPEGVIKEAQELAARAFGADSSFFLVNGSTCGIHAMIMTICSPGDKLIIGRDCHKSVIDGLILAGAEPVYIRPGFNGRFGISTTILPSDLEKALEENPDASGVLITRPNYYGICSNIEEIAAVTHSHGKALAVDEAHGAHLRFDCRLPVSAMEAGADICVQSAHKTLPALTQGSYLHVKSGLIDTDKLKFNLHMLQTSSPSYIIMAFLDVAREMMEKKGTELLEKLLGNVELFKGALNKDSGLFLLDENDIMGGRLDKTRMVVNVKNTGETGFAAEKILREKYAIQAEMPDFNNVVFIATVADRREDFESLSSALNEFAGNYSRALPLTGICAYDLKIPVQQVELKDIVRCKKYRVKLCEASGKASAGMITPYPPGIPVICPGEVISGEVVEYVYSVANSGGIVYGLNDNLEINVV